MSGENPGRLGRPVGRIAPPLVAGLTFLGLWEGVVPAFSIPAYLLPAPSAVGAALIADAPLLFPALLTTLGATAQALALAVVGGAGGALFLSRFSLARRAFMPFAVVLQATPVIAVAPVLLVWLDQRIAVLACAFIVAFFPLLTNFLAGLDSADPDLAALFRLYGANRRQMLFLLRLPSAAPFFFAGLRIAGGLALMGAVAAELAAGASGAGAGLAVRVAEAGYRLNLPRMFAGLALISAAGLFIYWALAALERVLGKRMRFSARPPGEE